jgi:hypothetical protein
MTRLLIAVVVVVALANAWWRLRRTRRASDG